MAGLFSTLPRCHPARDTSLEAEGLPQAADFSEFRWVFTEQLSSFLHVGGSLPFEWANYVQKAKNNVCILANEDAAQDIFSWAERDREKEWGLVEAVLEEEAAWESDSPLAQLSAPKLLLAGWLWANHLSSLKMYIWVPTFQGCWKIEDNVSKACGQWSPIVPMIILFSNTYCWVFSVYGYNNFILVTYPWNKY